MENYVCAHASESITHLNKNTLGVYLWQACIAAALSTLEHAMRVEVCSLVDTHARECRPTREVPAGTSPHGAVDSIYSHIKPIVRRKGFWCPIGKMWGAGWAGASHRCHSTHSYCLVITGSLQTFCKSEHQIIRDVLKIWYHSTIYDNTIVV